MQKDYQQIIEIDENIAKKFIPFRNRHDHWGDPSNRPLIPNVATIIPPDVDPEILPFLLYRMKLEELAYKTKYIDDQSVNIVWTENKIDTYLFPSYEDALLSRAYECLRYDKHMLIQEIDKAIPAVLPPQLILPPESELPTVHHIKKNFEISPQSEDLSIQNQSAEYEYSDDSGQQKDTPSTANEQDNENDSSYENEYYPQQPLSKDEDESRNPDSFSYNQSFNNNISKDLLDLPKISSYEEEHQSRNYMDTVYNNTPPKIQPSPPNLPFKESYKPPPPPYSNSSYRYGQAKYDNFNSSPKQQQIPPPPPPSFIQNFDRNSSIKIPPPPFLPPKQQQHFGPLPPPPPLIRSTPPQNSPNGPESGSQANKQWNKYGNY